MQHAEHYMNSAVRKFLDFVLQPDTNLDIVESQKENRFLEFLKKNWNIEMVYNFRPSDSLDLVVLRITSEMFLHPDQRPPVLNSAD